MRQLGPRTVAIAGAGAATGLATARRFAECGEAVVFIDSTVESVRAAADYVLAGDGRAAAYRLDPDSVDQWQVLAAMVRERHGPLDALLNCIEIGCPTAISGNNGAELDALVAGVGHGCRALARQMIDTGVRGQIVNVVPGIDPANHPRRLAG
ncbi:SDR family NAD(P)-dependent oxidoreductase [Nocardia sp. CA-128927]|uniref:SDR family NAD(P)-dependent oxidoreductase n=1 Tax=Nocardia sp. CA-128927 TaxID=3239975 RepID=UPI003D960BE6